MNRCILLLSFLIGYSAIGQMVYDWVNMQYIAGDLSDYPIKPYFQLEGNVRQIDEVRQSWSQYGNSKITKTRYTYFSNGALDQINQLEQDSSEFIFDYQFSANGEFKYQVYTYIFAGAKGRDTIQRDTIPLMYNDIQPDSIGRDSDGNVTYFRLNGAETHTKFDRHGRKIQDSIPENVFGDIYFVKYRYPFKIGAGGKVIRKEHFEGQQLIIKIVYKTDRKGNWTKCTIKSNRKRLNAILKRKIKYYGD